MTEKLPRHSVRVPRSARPRGGGLRGELPAETLARCTVRVNFSLMAEPADIADGGEEGVLRHPLAPSLTPHHAMP
jgi:hypothetical protein